MLKDKDDVIDISEHDNELMHHGIRGQRWGQRQGPPYPLDISEHSAREKKAGWADSLDKASTVKERAQRSIEKSRERQAAYAQAKALADEGKTPTEIAKIMGITSESSVRSLLNPESHAKMMQAQNTADFLKKRLDELVKDGYVGIDIGKGVENDLGVSKVKFDQSIEILKQEGYEVYKRNYAQVTNKGKYTTVPVLCPPGTSYKDIYPNKEIGRTTADIGTVSDYTSHDGGKTFNQLEYPASFDSKRLEVRYAEDGGKDKDGVIELRRGVPDISLGDAAYSQVRILVDGSHYMKGMAVYSDDLPKGVDIRFNTNKHKGTPVLGSKDNSVLKPIKNDPENPFGSLIKANGQSYYTDENGEKQLSVINKRSDEGDWEEWQDKLSAQFLSKQNKELIKRQLNLSLADKKAEFEEINSLTNPTLKRSLLMDFANDCDTTAVDLSAAALPRQKYQVILPVTSLKDDEVYAPNYREGETVALIRYPHGGTFEIPIVKVTHHNKEAQSFMGQAQDAVGINSNVAARLSGADFDGDTVMVIPCNSATSRVRITATHPLKDLEGFDTKESYPKTPGCKLITSEATQNNLMGQISNLITDMTIKGASEEELARAVKHSMVIIDAKKHELDYKRSEKENGIKELKDKYQRTENEDGSVKYGVATLISRAKSREDVPRRQGQGFIDPETGKMIYKNLPDEKLYYTDKKGNVHMRTQESTKMAETDDARTLSSGYQVEEIYANYANSLKSMANEARKIYKNTSDIKVNPQAKIVFKEEVDHLNAEINEIMKNKPKERRAQAIANGIMEKKKAQFDMTPSEIKKESTKALIAARAQVGAQRVSVSLTPSEWEAIQQGAIAANHQLELFKHMDPGELRDYATPTTHKTMTPAKIAKVLAMYESGNNNTEIADALGVSPTTIHNVLKEQRGKEASEHND